MSTGTARSCSIPRSLFAAAVVGVTVLAGCAANGTDSTNDTEQSDVSAPVGTGTGELGIPGFVDVSDAAGLTETHSDLPLTGQMDMTSGASVADVDLDGDLDIFLPRVGKPNSLYLNNGDGTFVDGARAAGISGPNDRFGSATGAFFDIEGDGDIDLFVAGAGQGPNQLFVNDGSGVFDEQASSRGLDWPAVDDDVLGSQHHGVSVADVDGDGYQDLLVLQWYKDLYSPESLGAAAVTDGEEADGDSGERPGACETAAALRASGFPVPDGTPPSRSTLFINDGAGRFQDRTRDFGLPLDEIVAFTGSFGDIDDDGWQDLAITGDGCTSRLFHNLGGERFEDITEQAGVGTDENGMGSVLRDVDGDGTLDWFVTSISYPTDAAPCPVTGFFGCSGNRLYLNNGDLTFRDATDEFGLRDGGWGWGAAIEDFDNSGQLSVAMTNGFDVFEKPGGDPNDPETVYLRTHRADRNRFWVLADGGFSDIAPSVGLDDDTVGHGLVPFDMDGDGDLDLLIVPSGQEAPRLYRNDLARGGSWLTIALDDPSRPGNRWGDGARIAVVPDEGDEPVVGYLTTSGSYESQKPPSFHVGLGPRTAPVDRIEITWPGSSDPQVIEDVALNQALVVERG